jgi:2-succinyl-6-hydroxy-2,4-cyclohexadiene-1-carboxylate synthase
MKTKLHWHVFGREDARTVVLLHGFMGDGGGWSEIARLLGKRFRCFCPDLPGHGRSPAPDSPASASMESVARAVVSDLPALGIPACALAGYSMGGRLALYLALRYGGIFSRVVLESASPGLCGEEERKQRRLHDESLARRLEAISAESAGAEVFLREWYGQPLFASLSKYPEKTAALIRHRAGMLRGGAMAAMLRGMGAGSQPPLWGALAACTTPTLLITGSEDRKYCRIAEKMGECCPALAVHSITGAGHNVHLEKPESYTTVLRVFLNPSMGTEQQENGKGSE